MDDLTAIVRSAMLESQRFLEALMQEVPLGAPTAGAPYDFHTLEG